ncbi:MAG: hypothetical protein ABWY20_12610 [Mycobacterium sp.]
MPTPELLPADGDPPEDPRAELAPPQGDRSGAADHPRTELPVPESFPSGRGTGAGA